MLVGEIISRVRNQIKALHQDAFITDRMIYSVIYKYTSVLMKREDGVGKIAMQRGIYKPLVVDLEKVEVLDGFPKLGSLYKTVDPITRLLMDGYYGKFIRSVSSVSPLGGSVQCQPINIQDFRNIYKSSSYKYNKTKYYWEMDGYLYFPDTDWKKIEIIGIPESNISCYYNIEGDGCKSRQDLEFNVPNYLHAEIEQMVLKDFATLYQLPTDQISDNQNVLK